MMVLIKIALFIIFNWNFNIFYIVFVIIWIADYFSGSVVSIYSMYLDD